VRLIRLSLVCAVLLLVATTPALAYPRVLLDAVTKVYGPRKLHVDSLCHEKIGKSTYVRVDITLVASGKARSIVFQWVRGWRPIWKDGAILKSVPKRERAHFRWIMRELNRFCGA
jgi:hypothetical protein